MEIKRITAIVPIEILDYMETHLRECGVPGVTVERVRGYGHHPNYFRRDLMAHSARLVLYTGADRVEELVDAIVHCARECDAQAGILAVESIDRLVRLTDGADVTTSSL